MSAACFAIDLISRRNQRFKWLHLPILNPLVLQKNKQIKAKPCISSAVGGISSTRSVAYHQFRKKLHIIKPTEFLYTPFGHDDIRRTLFGNDIHAKA